MSAVALRDNITEAAVLPVAAVTASCRTDILLLCMLTAVHPKSTRNATACTGLRHIASTVMAKTSSRSELPVANLCCSSRELAAVKSSYKVWSDNALCISQMRAGDRCTFTAAGPPSHPATGATDQHQAWIHPAARKLHSTCALLELCIHLAHANESLM